MLRALLALSAWSAVFQSPTVTHAQAVYQTPAPSNTIMELAQELGSEQNVPLPPLFDSDWDNDYGAMHWAENWYEDPGKTFQIETFEWDADRAAFIAGGFWGYASGSANQGRVEFAFASRCAFTGFWWHNHSPDNHGNWTGRCSQALAGAPELFAYATATPPADRSIQPATSTRDLLDLAVPLPSDPSNAGDSPIDSERGGSFNILDLAVPPPAGQTEPRNLKAKNGGGHRARATLIHPNAS